MTKEYLLSVSEMKILRFLNEFGFCEIEQIMKRFEMSKSNAYFHMKQLVQREFLVNARVIKYQARAYYLTRKIIAMLELDLPVIRRIPLHVYEHQLDVINIHIQLKKIYPDALWISERRLMKAKKNDHDHLPDGVLFFSKDNQCAIEVEKTPKAKGRLEGIMLEYGLQKTYKEVWYFCSKAVFPAVSHFANSMPYIKVFQLAEYV